MSRFFRFYEKKRGDRRTGSKAFGSLGEALFFGFFLVVGCAVFAAMFGTLVWPEWRANRQFVSTTATVVDKQIGEKPASESEAPGFRPDIRIRYDAEGRPHEVATYDITRRYLTDKQAVLSQLDEFEIGREYPAWYDPLDHQRVVLVRGYSGWLYVLLLIPISAITIGGGRLIYTLLHWNASAERRSLIAQRAAQLDLFEVETADRGFPNVPADANLTNSPGTTLAYRLPIAASTGWALFASTMACIIWNGIVAVFVVMAARSFVAEEPDWMLCLLIVPFLAVGIGLIVYLARQIFLATGVGTTRVEISRHPLAPGEQYEIFLSQAGRMAMKSLELWLACDEKATYRQGTDTRTELRRVYEQRCFTRAALDLQSLPFESRCQVQVPEGAMHSFQANHNEVNWKLIVKGSVVGWRDFERVFQIVVNPATNGQHRR